eukprot:922500_1
MSISMWLWKISMIALLVTDKFVESSDSSYEESDGEGYQEFHKDVQDVTICGKKVCHSGMDERDYEFNEEYVWCGDYNIMVTCHVHAKVRLQGKKPGVIVNDYVNTNRKYSVTGWHVCAGRVKSEPTPDQPCFNLAGKYWDDDYQIEEFIEYNGWTEKELRKLNKRSFVDNWCSVL